MVVTTIEWHKPTEKLPEKSEDYFVRTETNTWVTSYSIKYKRFNARDHYDEDFVKRHSFPLESVLYWAEKPEFPEDESEA
jgi:hypothetical protein